MADELKPLPIEDASLSVDGFSTDFDENLKAETAAARAKPLSEFSGDKPDASASDDVISSGSVDDDALRAAVAETVAEPVAAPAAASTDVAKPEAAKPEAAAPAAAEPAKPEAAAPAEPAKRTYDPAEVFSVAEGVDLTREQITQGLRERNAWGQAAQTFADVFKCTPEQAQQYWKPYVERLIAEPALGTYIDNAIADYGNAAKRKYLDDCRAFFDSNGQVTQAQQPQVAAIPPEVRMELDAARDFRARIEAQSAQERVLRERAELTKAAPALANDAAWKQLCQYAHAKMTQQQIAGQPVTYTLADGLRDMQRDAALFAASQPAAAAPAAQPAQVPVLNQSSGASAAAQRQQVDMKPRTFKTPDDALADWDTNVAGALGYK